ncbi:DNA methyltransferase [Actinokineospora bangkokensis]|nr:DNA methyltransferase [Actinokineospora bangkokensis]
MRGEPLPGWREASTPPVRWHNAEKPVSLMRQLVRIARPGGLVLDPFTGSGSTGVAALLEQRRFLGIECMAEHHRIAQQRLRLTARALQAGIDPGDPRTPAHLDALRDRLDHHTDHPR